MSDMARMLGYSANRLNTVASQDRERFPYRKVPTASRMEIGQAMLSDGMPVAEVASSLKVSESTVRRWKRAMP